MCLKKQLAVLLSIVDSPFFSLDVLFVLFPWFLLDLWSFHLTANTSSYSSLSTHFISPHWLLFVLSCLSVISTLVVLSSHLWFLWHLVLSILVMLSSCLWPWYLSPELLSPFSLHLSIPASRIAILVYSTFLKWSLNVLNVFFYVCERK